MSTNKFKIAALIPTRGRTKPLETSIKSLIERARYPDTIQILIAFDNDDTKTIKYFQGAIRPWMDDNNVNYTVLSMDRMGYQNLNLYYNKLAEYTDSDWFMGWGDDSIMETLGWDTKIAEHDGKFKLLKVHTHNEHPYSIFPIIPRAWYELRKIFSTHQMPDAELSQMAYMLDIMEIIDVSVTHDRADLTGKKPDATHQNRVSFEGNPNDPRDFHHKDNLQRRLNDCETISKYLDTQGINTSFWKGVMAGTQDPWEKLKANDINQQMVQHKIIYKI